MDSLPIQYLHLESAITPLFLLMMLLIQLARAKKPDYFFTRTRLHVQLLIAGFVLLSLVCVGILANTSPLMGAEIAAGLTLSMLHPMNALCFFVHLLYLRPWEIQVTNPLLLALPRGLSLLCFFSWLLHPSQHGKPNAHALKTLNLLLFFSTWLLLSTFITPDILESQSTWFGVYFKSILMFIMCLYFIDSERSIAEFKFTLILSTLALMTVRYYQYHAEGSHLLRLQTGGMFGDSNDLAAVIVLALPFALAPLARKTGQLGYQLMGGFFALFALMIVWYAESRGAMLALFAQVLTVYVLRTGGKKWKQTLLLLIVLGAGYSVTLKNVGRESEEMSASSESRITYWKTAVNMTVHHPLFGVGFYQYPANYDKYSIGTKYEWGKRTAHSSWFLVLAESGFFGFGLFVAFFASVLRTAWRDRDRWPEHVVSLVGYGVAISFLSHPYLMYLYLMTGLIMAAHSLKERSPHVA